MPDEPKHEDGGAQETDQKDNRKGTFKDFLKETRTGYVKLVTRSLNLPSTTKHSCQACCTSTSLRLGCSIPLVSIESSQSTFSTILRSVIFCSPPLNIQMPLS